MGINDFQNSRMVSNVKISLIKLDESVSEIVQLAIAKKPSYVCFANSHMVAEATRNKDFTRDVNGANFVFADGVPVAKVVKWIHGVKQDQIAGIDFMDELIPRCDQEGFSVLFFGSTPTVFSKVKEKMERDFPRVKVFHIYPPNDSLWSDDSYVKQINDLNINIVFVVLGCPKQEKWMAKYYSKINAVLLGVGGAMEVFAGTKWRIPKFIRNFALEWLFRLVQEPRRLWKRYMISNSLFIYYITKQLFGGSPNKY